MSDTFKGCALRLCVAWLVLSALGYWQGTAFLRLCAPVISATVRSALRTTPDWDAADDPDRVKEGLLTIG